MLMYLTNNTVGAPILNTVAGSLLNVLNWALVTEHGNWDREYHNGTTFESVFRAKTGNRHRLYVGNSSIISSTSSVATVRGCEDATSASSLIDAFPTVTQLANNASFWYFGIGTTPRNYKIIVWDTGFLFIPEHSPGEYTLNGFLDVPSTEDGDNQWNTILLKNSGAPQGAALALNMTNRYVVDGTAYGPSVYFCRDITGTIKSSVGMLNGYGTPISVVPYTQVPRASYKNELVAQHLGINDCGSTTTTFGTNAIIKRCYFPNVYNLLISGYNSDESFSKDSADFEILRMPGNQSSSILLETTDTWQMPV